MKRQGQALSLKNLTKSNVWDIQENDVFRLWAQAERDADLRDNERHYIDVIKSAFTIEEVKLISLKLSRNTKNVAAKLVKLDLMRVPL